MTKDNTAEVRLSELNNLPVEVVDLLVLKQAGVIPGNCVAAKVFLSGAIARPVKLQGILATKGARTAIESAGGSIAE